MKVKLLWFAVLMASFLFVSSSIGNATALTFDLLPNSSLLLEVVGNLDAPSAITMTESTSPNLLDVFLEQWPLGGGFHFGIYSTELYQSGSADTGFMYPTLCNGSDCKFMVGFDACFGCGIDFIEGYSDTRLDGPVSIPVTDSSRYFKLVNLFQLSPTVLVNDTILPIDLKLTIDLPDGLSIISAQSFGDIAATPVPPAFPLFATGLGGLCVLGWRRKRKSQAAA